MRFEVILEEFLVWVDLILLEVEGANHTTISAWRIVYTQYNLTHHIRGILRAGIWFVVVESDESGDVRAIKEWRVGRASILIIGLEFETTS